jgi:CubicO group peptidase (beta-lactamase class C family)
MTSAQYQAEFDAAKAKGLFPLRVSAKGEGANTRFAAIFTARETTDKRVFRAKGPAANAAIDGAMESFMKAHDLRGAALAITMGAKLVYTKGYTWAEASPIYPDVLPTTRFRQASVSKTFTAVALYRLMQQDATITLDTTMQSILGLKKPNGGNANADFNSIKLKHLIESTSGIDQSLIWQSQLAAAEFGVDVPPTQEQFARYAAKFDVPGTPGDTHNVVYGNFDYFLLSQVIAKLANAATFEAALKKLVLDPLGMTRTRGSRSLVNDQVNDEARYHLRVYEPPRLYPLAVGVSVRTAAQPFVPYQYGGLDYELIDGCGGLSSAVVDLARLIASFSAGDANPVLNSTSVTAMLTNAAIAKATYSGPDAHGYHGFDDVFVDLPSQTFAAGKGGWLASHEGGISFFTKGVGFAVTYNGNKKINVANDWAPAVLETVLSTNWGNTDLFPGFGMNSFGGPGVIVQLPLKLKTMLNPNAAIVKVARANKRTQRFDPRQKLQLRGR